MRPGKRRRPRGHTQRKLRPACYVCGRRIRKGPVYIGAEKYRHKRCKPGSQRYERIKLQPQRRRGLMNINCDRKRHS